jgi:hypothetical protein
MSDDQDHNVVRKFDVGVYSEGSYVDAQGVISEDHTEAGFHAGSSGFLNAGPLTEVRTVRHAPNPKVVAIHGTSAE